jgi:hypothetical protein
MGKYFRTLTLLVSLICLGFLLVSCSVKNRLPQSALDKLKEAWAASPYLSISDLNILKTWPGEISAEESSDEFAAMEIWCVEVEMPPDPDSTGEPLPMIWFINRNDPQSEWTVAPLMIMSSSWPYEACGAWN